jgi:putative nucleotidyltransferase with HDIG domain
MGNYLRSKLGTRMALLFVLCALVPIVLLSTVSFVQVIGQLRDESRNRIRQETRAIAQAIVERLAITDRDFSLVGRLLADGHDVNSFMLDDQATQPRGDLLPFAALSMGPSEAPRVIFGQAIPPVSLTPEQEEHLAEGKSVIASTVETMTGRHLQIIRAMPSAAEPQWLRARISSDYLWTALTEYKLAEISNLCVLDADGRIIYTIAPVSPALLSEVGERIRSTSADLFDWREHGRSHFVGYRNIFLSYQYGLPRLTVIASRPIDLALAPIAPFRRGFPVLVLLCVWVVLFLTLYEVRRRLVPLRKLIDGTCRIAEQDFQQHVDIATGDEFEELAEAFNTMSQKIGRQVHVLNVIGEIDRGLLAAVAMDEIVGRALDGLSRVFSGCSVAIAILAGEEGKQTRAYVVEPGADRPRMDVVDDLSERECARLMAVPEGVEIDPRERLPSYLSSIRRPEHRAFVVVPIVLGDRLEGVISVGAEGAAIPRTDAEHLHQVASQIALAMANARLVGALQQQNWGIVRALARAVDTKSTWTLGHSERVTKLGLLIARELNYTPHQLEELERGALLHDIGKIGISTVILDKAGTLTDEERLLVREHPRLGRRIVEPVGLDKDILCIVAQHHERYDGQGYPLGLSGDAIALSARIIAVADVTDAMAAKRPYRDKMPFGDVVEAIARDSGKAFDPEVVAAFLRVVQNGDSLDAVLEPPLPEPGSPSPSSDEKVGVNR